MFFYFILCNVNKNSKKTALIEIRTIQIRPNANLHFMSQERIFTYPNIPTLSEAAYMDWNFACIWCYAR